MPACIRPPVLSYRGAVWRAWPAWRVRAHGVVQLCSLMRSAPPRRSTLLPLLPPLTRAPDAISLTTLLATLCKLCPTRTFAVVARRVNPRGIASRRMRHVPEIILLILAHRLIPVRVRRGHCDLSMPR